MPVTIQEKLSWVPIQIEILYNEEVLGLGTAFFYSENGKTYLITNWHNVSGRNPETLKAIHKDAALPNKLKLFYPMNAGNIKELPEGASTIGWNAVLLELYENEKPVWFEHPSYGKKVDAIAIELNVDDTELYVANSPELDLTKITLRPSLDVFVLGYPRGLTGGARFPVWKRGSIASEPEIDLDYLPT